MPRTLLTNFTALDSDFLNNLEFGMVVKGKADLQNCRFDANNNGLFGEVEDSIDLYADLSVGRAPVNNVMQARTFVQELAA